MISNREEAAEADTDDPAPCTTEADTPPEPRGSSALPATPNPTPESPRSPQGDRSSDDAPVPVTIGVEPPAEVDAADVAWIGDRVREAIACLARPVAQLRIAIVDDNRMIAMNRRHLSIDGTTDVLAFPESDPETPIDADVAINVDEATRQATRRGHDPRRELLLYGLHGLLHCAGFADHDPDARRVMHEEEDRILQTIGVGATFDRPERAGETGERDLS